MIYRFIDVYSGKFDDIPFQETSRWKWQRTQPGPRQEVFAGLREAAEVSNMWQLVLASDMYLTFNMPYLMDV